MTNMSPSAQKLPHFSTESSASLGNHDGGSPLSGTEALAGSGRIRGGNVQVGDGGGRAQMIFL